MFHTADAEIRCDIDCEKVPTSRGLQSHFLNGSMNVTVGWLDIIIVGCSLTLDKKKWK